MLDWALHPHSAARIIEGLARDWTVSSFLEFARHQSPRTYGWVMDYAWPPTVHSQVPLRDNGARGCHGLQTTLRETLANLEMSLLSVLQVDSTESGTDAELLVAPNGSRGYPMHQHGSVNDNLLLVLSGTKQVFVFPPSAEDGLIERAELPSSEFGDRFFVRDVREAVATVPGAAGTVGAGSLVYIPCNSIHLVENFGDVVAIAVHVQPREGKAIAVANGQIPGGPTSGWRFGGDVFGACMRFRWLYRNQDDYEAATRGELRCKWVLLHRLRSRFARVLDSLAAGSVLWDRLVPQPVEILNGSLYRDLEEVR